MHSRLSSSLLYRKITDFARTRSRVSVIAATAAAAGVLSAAGFAVSAASSAPAGHPSTSGQHGDLFRAPNSTKFVKPAGSAQLDGSADSASGTGATPATANKPAKGQRVTAADVIRHRAQQAAKRQAAKERAATQAAKAKAAKAARVKAAKAKAAKAQAAKVRAAKVRAAKARAAKARAAKPYRIYDSVSPGKIPAGRGAAVYVNGAYAASPAHLGRHHPLLWIDVNGSDPKANVLDVEPGDATPAGAARWVKRRLSADRHAVAIIYTMRNEWQQVKDNVATLPSWMRPKVRYWIADPTGVPHVVAGANATQWYWGKHYDISTAKPDFMR